VINEVVDLGDARPVAPEFLAVVYIIDDRRQPLPDPRRYVVLASINSLQTSVVRRCQRVYQRLFVDKQLRTRRLKTSSRSVNLLFTINPT